MITDTTAVARWAVLGPRATMGPSDSGEVVLFTDHERVVGELRAALAIRSLPIREYTEEINTLRTALAASRAEVEGLKRDAERYRFLRSGGGGATLRFHNTNPANRDDAIDAAMENNNV